MRLGNKAGSSTNSTDFNGQTPVKHNALDPRKHPWRFAGVVVGSMLLTFALLMAWIGLTVLVNQDTAHPVAADVVFNYLLVTVLSFVGLPLFHWSMLKRQRLAEQRRLSGKPVDRHDTIAAAMFADDPLPDTPITWGQRLLYIGTYVYGIGLLMTVFGPLDHQRWLIRMIARFSAGSASFGTLANLVILVPTGVMLLLVLVLFDRDPGDRSQQTEADVLRRKMKQQWLYAFVTSLGAAAFICFFAGRLTAAYLS